MKAPSNLKLWVDIAEHGDKVVYHVGTHAGGDICREAYDLYEAGMISLVRQRKDKTSTFEYIAQRTKTKRR